MACSDADDAPSRAAERLRQGQGDAPRDLPIAGVELRAAAGQYGRAAGVLRPFVDLMPREIPALLKLVQLTVERGQLSSAAEAMGRLADALIAPEPWARSHLERLAGMRPCLPGDLPDRPGVQAALQGAARAHAGG